MHGAFIDEEVNHMTEDAYEPAKDVVHKHSKAGAPLVG